MRSRAAKADEDMLAEDKPRKTFAPAGEVPIRIDAKTVIYAKAGQDPEEVKRKFLERVEESKMKANKEGGHNPNHQPWKEAEVKILRDNLQATAKEIHKLLPNRSLATVRNYLTKERKKAMKGVEE